MARVAVRTPAVEDEHDFPEQPEEESHAPRLARQRNSSVYLREAKIFSPQERILIQKRQYARNFLIETLAYILFVSLFTYVTVALRPSYGYEMTNVIRNVELTAKFTTITSADDFWLWANSTLLPSLFPTGETVKPFFVAGSNRLIGTVRFRQVRTKETGSCHIEGTFTSQVHRCVFHRGELLESTDSYGRANPNSTSYLWNWQSGKELCEGGFQNNVLNRYCAVLIVGRTNVAYPPSGFVVEFPPASYFDAVSAWEVQAQNATANGTALPPKPDVQQYAFSQLKRLQENLWIDPLTAFISIEFSMYNANVQLLTASRLMLEFYPTGQVVPKYSVKSVSLLKLATSRDYVILTAEIILALAVARYLWEEFKEVYEHFTYPTHDCVACNIRRIRAQSLSPVICCTNCQRPFNPFYISHCPECHKDVPMHHMCWKGWIADAWNFLEFWNLLIFAVVVAYRFKLRVDYSRVAFGPQNLFHNIYPLVWQAGTAGYFNSLNMLMTYVKILKYLGRIRTLAILVRTLRYAAVEVGRFLLFFFVLYIGASLAFFLCFGPDVYAFRDWLTSGTTLFRALLLQFDYPSLKDSNSILAPVLFNAFMLVMVLMLANVFISILDHAYVRSNSESKANVYDFLNSSLKLLFHQWQRGFRCCAPNTLLDRTLELLDGIATVPELSKDELDDVRLFHKEMSDRPDAEVMTAVVKGFAGRRITARYYYSDYRLLHQIVMTHRENMKRQQESREPNPWADESVFAPRVSKEEGRHLRGIGGKAAAVKKSPIRNKDDQKTFHKLILLQQKLTAAQQLWEETRGTLPSIPVVYDPYNKEKAKEAEPQRRVSNGSHCSELEWPTTVLVPKDISTEEAVPLSTPPQPQPSTPLPGMVDDGHVFPPAPPVPAFPRSSAQVASAPPPESELGWTANSWRRPSVSSTTNTGHTLRAQQLDLLNNNNTSRGPSRKSTPRGEVALIENATASLEIPTVGSGAVVQPVPPAHQRSNSSSPTPVPPTEPHENAFHRRPRSNSKSPSESPSGSSDSVLASLKAKAKASVIAAVDETPAMIEIVPEPHEETRSTAQVEPRPQAAVDEPLVKPSPKPVSKPHPRPSLFPLTRSQQVAQPPPPPPPLQSERPTEHLSLSFDAPHFASRPPALPPPPPYRGAPPPPPLAHAAGLPPGPLSRRAPPMQPRPGLLPAPAPAPKPITPILPSEQELSVMHSPPQKSLELASASTDSHTVDSMSSISIQASLSLAQIRPNRHESLGDQPPFSGTDLFGSDVKQIAHPPQISHRAETPTAGSARNGAASRSLFPRRKKET
eukprot:TRINITY_DN4523_c0_g1_i1.p1 TRINITY_DN4523_c0_g1~~TRINITY_DN4523_c0_g1_i1.p1  ORF type:complete len:1302 (+),score=179.66 TRINITY_DN4523_c0_g1_i1:96-4001(+)